MTRLETLKDAYARGVITGDQFEEFVDAELSGKIWAAPYAMTLEYQPEPEPTKYPSWILRRLAGATPRRYGSRP